MNFLAWISIIIISWALVATWKYIVQNTALEPRNLPEMVDQSFASLSAACGQDEPEITQRPIDRKESPNETSSPSHQKTQTDAPSPHEPKADKIKDVYIAIMGVTGSGKSSFIELCSGNKVGIGHNLRSETQDVTEFHFMLTPNMRVHLIDTPGFDDTERKDIDILRDIAAYLGGTYQRDIRLSGIVYLHRIIDPKMQGSAKRNLFMFRKLCGEECFNQIALVTAWWSQLQTADEGVRREKQLIDTDDYWGYMRQNGSHILRHEVQNDRASALAILFTIISSQKTVVLQIQKEMCKEGVSLQETDAGKQLNADIMEELKKHRKEVADLTHDLEDALKRHDEKSVADIQKLMSEHQERMKAGEESQKKMKIDFQKLQAERQAEREAYEQKLDDKLKIAQEKLLEEQRKIQEDHKREMDDERATQENARLKAEVDRLSWEKTKLASDSSRNTRTETLGVIGTVASVVGKTLEVGFQVAGAVVITALEVTATEEK